MWLKFQSIADNSTSSNRKPLLWTMYSRHMIQTFRKGTCIFSFFWAEKFIFFSTQELLSSYHPCSTFKKYFRRWLKSRYVDLVISPLQVSSGTMFSNTTPSTPPPGTPCCEFSTRKHILFMSENISLIREYYMKVNTLRIVSMTVLTLQAEKLPQITPITPKITPTKKIQNG